MVPKNYTSPSLRRNTALSAATLLIGSILLFGVVAFGYGNYISDSELYDDGNTGVKSPLLIGGIKAEAGQKTIVESPEKSAQVIGQPTRIIIADIGVNSKIVNTSVDKTNKIEHHINHQSVGWLNNTKKPGDSGSAVIIGEYALNGRAVFSNLAKLKIGQKILIIDDVDASMVFEVTSISRESEPILDDVGSGEEAPLIKLLGYTGSNTVGVADLNVGVLIRAALVK